PLRTCPGRAWRVSIAASVSERGAERARERSDRRAWRVSIAASVSERGAERARERSDRRAWRLSIAASVSERGAERARERSDRRALKRCAVPPTGAGWLGRVRGAAYAGRRAHDRAW